MNEKQKAFLNELTALFKKYQVEDMIIFEGRICISSNGQTLAFESFIQKSDELSYFYNIVSTQQQYLIRGKDQEECELPL